MESHMCYIEWLYQITPVLHFVLHICAMVEARVFKFCTQVSYIKY